MRDGGFQGGLCPITELCGGGWDAGQPHSILGSLWAWETLPASEGLPVVWRGVSEVLEDPKGCGMGALPHN